MFTGLIEEVGVVLAVERETSEKDVAEKGAVGCRFTVGTGEAARILDAETRIGDSIAVDGACMTVVAFDERRFTFEASPESLARTTLGDWQPGRRVNLERPLTPASRIGGHYVTGHVDGLARVIAREACGNSVVFSFEADTAEMAELLVPKGSVAVLGISLTVNTVSDRRFSVAIIPHTLAHTSLGDYHPGDRVNIETDLLGKYVRRLLPGHRARDLDEASVIGAGASTVGPETVAGPELDIPALRPATEAIRSTQAFAASRIRTGGWFNFEES
jgi:riboflavin synthase